MTYLLQDSLGGNSRTMMIVTVCPTEFSSEESIFSLQFASRVRNVNLGTTVARKNVNPKNLEEALKAAKVEIKEAKKKRAQLEDQITELKREQKKIADKMSSQMDNKIKMVDDAKKSAESHIQQQTRQYNDLQSRLHEERENKQKVQQELEVLQKAFKKCNDQVQEFSREREAMMQQYRAKEKEIANLKLRSSTSGTSGHTAPPSRHSESSTGTNDSFAVPEAIRLTSTPSTKVSGPTPAKSAVANVSRVGTQRSSALSAALITTPALSFRSAEKVKAPKAATEKVDLLGSASKGSSELFADSGTSVFLPCPPPPLPCVDQSMSCISFEIVVLCFCGTTFCSSGGLTFIFCYSSNCILIHATNIE